MRLGIKVKKRLGSFCLEVDADISGDRIGIFGDSGSGKSSLVNLVAGLMQPDEGEIVLNGESLFSSRRRVNISPEKRGIAIVFQQAMLFSAFERQK